MGEEVERSIRGKLLDLQIFLTSETATEAKLKEIDEKLEVVLEVVKPKTGEPKCEA